MREKGNIRKVIKNNIFLLKIFYKAAPGYLILSILERIRNEVVIYLEFTFGLNYVLECAEFGRPFKDAALFLICLLSFVVLGLLFNAFLYQKIRMKTEPKVKQALKELMYQKVKEIDLACYDNPKFYNDYILAITETDNQYDRMSDLIDYLCTGLVSIILSSSFFITSDPVSIVFIAISFIIALMSGKALNKINVKARTEKNPYERKLDYTNRVFYLNEYAKEVRLNTDVSEALLKNFDSNINQVYNIEKAYSGKRFRLYYLKNYIGNNFIIDILYMIYLVYSAAVLHRISYSNVAVMHSTANRTKSRMGMFSDVYPKMQEISMYTDKMRVLLSMESKINSKSNRKLPDKPTEIELKNVSFGYNATDGAILKNINMKIMPFSKIAIVGYNGAGKTTLIKLILRLYDPDEGEILLNGINIKEYEITEYRKKIGTVFQDFKIFAATVKENVLLDFPENEADDIVIDALYKSGFSDRLESLKDGINTNLTTEFEDDGVNLSGGEGQKVAIARVFYSNANLIILDEPSSALDPIAEYNLNHSMLTAAENKSVIFISHRLSTTRVADQIYMLEKGRIIEQGNHDELIKKNGKYAEMWRVQAGQYA